MIEATSALGSRTRRSLAFSRVRLGRTEIALAAILVAGIGLRLWVIHTWRPAFLGYPDSSSYIYSAHLGGVGISFWDPYHPAGYSVFLGWLHAIRADLAFAIDIQHVMGLVAATLLFVIVTRFTRRRWVALLPVIVVAFAGSEIYLEHAALSETLYTLLVVLAMWCAVRSYDSRGQRESWWLLATGVLIALSAVVRPLGVFLGPVVILWAAASRRGRSQRLRRVGSVTVGLVLALGSYLAYQHSVTGSWSLTRTTGDYLYARAAIFADCRDFTPPAGTRRLCQPPNQPKLGPYWTYLSDTDSPAVRSFGLPPDGPPYRWPPDGKLGAFGVAAVVHQPWQYAWTTIEGLVKYVDSSFGSPLMLNDHGFYVDLHEPVWEAKAAPLVAMYYPHHATVHHNTSALDDYARAARVSGPITALLLVLTLVGLVLARERRRAGLTLIAGTTAILMVAPVALADYSIRYATPAYGPLAAGAAIGLDELIEYVQARRRASAGNA